MFYVFEGGGKRLIQPKKVDPAWDITMRNAKMTVCPKQTLAVQGVVLKDSGYVVFDIDEPNVTYEECVEAFPWIKGHLTCKGNTKGFHVWCKNPDNRYRTSQMDCLMGLKGDVLCSTLVCEAEGKTWTGLLQDMPIIDEFVDPKKLNRLIDMKKKTVVQSPYISNASALETEFLSYIKLLPNDDWQTWRNIGFALFSVFGPEKGAALFDTYSRVNKAQYDEATSKGFFDSIKPVERPYTFAYIRSLVPAPPLYISGAHFNQGALKLSHLLVPHLRGDLIYCGEKWYVGGKTNLWKVVKKPSFELMTLIQRICDASREITIARIPTTEEEESIF